MTTNYIVLATLFGGYYLSRSALHTASILPLHPIAIVGAVLGVVSIPLVAYGGSPF